jgi:hypothetical protein
MSQLSTPPPGLRRNLAKTAALFLLFAIPAVTGIAYWASGGSADARGRAEAEAIYQRAHPNGPERARAIEAFTACSYCGGSGIVDYVGVRMGRQTRLAVPCPRCSGTGRIANPAMIDHYEPHIP